MPTTGLSRPRTARQAKGNVNCVGRNGSLATLPDLWQQTGPQAQQYPEHPSQQRPKLRNSLRSFPLGRCNHDTW